MNTKKVRTRIAPSPTGEDIHIGNLYTALINYVFAKKNNGEFIIRIEDTDRGRFQEGAEKRILSSVKSFGLTYSEGPDIGGPFKPYRQSERLEIYQTFAKKLIEKKNAYYCFCTKERLDELRAKQSEMKQTPRYDKHCLENVQNSEERISHGEKYVVRLNVPRDQVVTFTDVIRGGISFNTNEMDDQVLLKSDGFPTYHLGVVIDDHLMEVSHVIRAEEWISSTPKHVLLYQFFDWELPIFAHLPILRNPDKSKLSKRKNPVWASWYIEEGYLPEAVLNYLALMGWSHPEQKEIFSLDEFVSVFELKDIHPVGPAFDSNKLRWMNQQYIQNLSDGALFEKIVTFYSDKKLDSDLLKKIIPLLKTRMETLKDFEDLAAFIFEAPKVSLNQKEKEIASKLGELLASVDWDEEKILLQLKNILQEYDIRMPTLYKIVTGKEKGLPLPQSLASLPKDEVINRLRDALS
ncbi:MAG: glutamate--tRNA ligase [Candidatus Levybacteria bacterium]|nr:glutamate--tRNA ligase [Candidatus Levybacteria bacterium]